VVNFQFHIKHRAKYCPFRIADIMKKINLSVLCILIAVQSRVKGIIFKVQEAKSELQPSTEMQLAGK
jgi:hypothetical protein